MSRKPTKIRLARLPEEEPALEAFLLGLQIYEHAFEPNRRLDGKVAGEYFAVLMDWVEEKAGRIFVAEDEAGVLQGWAVTLVGEDEIFVVKEERDYGFVAELFVAEGARGQGVGHALVKAAEEDFRARGFSIVMIGVLSGNARARRAYEAWGFEPSSMRLRKRL